MSSKTSSKASRKSSAQSTPRTRMSRGSSLANLANKMNLNGDTTGSSGIRSGRQSMSVDRTPMSVSAASIKDVHMYPADYRDRGMSSSGGTTPSSRGTSYSSTNYSFFKSPPSSRGSVLARALNNKLNVANPPDYVSPFDASAPANSAFLDMPARSEAEQLLHQQRLEIARHRYIKTLKKKIYNGDRPRPAQEPLGPPKIYNAIETAQDRRANHLFLFPDSDPAVYRRQINMPNTFTHQPVFGF